MVDSINSIRGGKNPSILANYTVKDTESLYSDNGSDDHWPSMYIIEGLGQCCNLLIIIWALEKGLMKSGHTFNSMGEVLMRLMNDETDEITRILQGFLQQRLMETYSTVGFMGSADVEFTGHAMQGQEISYEVQLNQVFGSLYHLSVRAYTDINLIARGTMVSAGGKN